VEAAAQAGRKLGVTEDDNLTQWRKIRSSPLKRTEEQVIVQGRHLLVRMRARPGRISGVHAYIEKCRAQIRMGSSHGRSAVTSTSSINDDEGVPHPPETTFKLITPLPS